MLFYRYHFVIEGVGEIIIYAESEAKAREKYLKWFKMEAPTEVTRHPW